MKNKFLLVLALGLSVGAGAVWSQVDLSAISRHMAACDELSASTQNMTSVCNFQKTFGHSARLRAMFADGYRLGLFGWNKKY